MFGPVVSSMVGDGTLVEAVVDAMVFFFVDVVVLGTEGAADMDAM